MPESAGARALQGFAGDLDHEHAQPRTVAVTVSEVALPDDDRAKRFLVYLGAYDLLAEAAQRERGTDHERAAEDLFAVLKRVQAAEGPLRFALHQKLDLAERQELMTRMRGKEIAVTEAWLIPRLRGDIAAYRARIEALRSALARGGDGGR